MTGDVIATLGSVIVIFKVDAQVFCLACNFQCPLEQPGTKLKHRQTPVRVKVIGFAQTYMLKLAKSGEEGEKAFLVLESGSRFHTTQVLSPTACTACSSDGSLVPNSDCILHTLQYQKEKSDTPSNFTLKLRKHLRTRRLEDIKQLGVDRIVDFQFGSGDARYHLSLELYSQVPRLTRPSETLTAAP